MSQHLLRHLGRFALVTVAKVNNLEELAQQLLDEGMHLSEFSSGRINPTEVIALLIIKGKTFRDGIENVFRTVKGSCSMAVARKACNRIAVISHGKIVELGDTEDVFTNPQSEAAKAILLTL